ncbi:ParA family partition ATPase [Acetobacter pasteurianus]|uniref:Cobyrinic acid a,c-diamide synthase n=1 Tax=Acetobacter pasteurianus NBRC 3278 TaxID=1226660 RepID=A0A401X9B5_ACEPA|nr:ParA family partition ATPase [Acetobacter pasteurianus]GCD60596.1 cobyrinic acid a,c-diamide synthase [Acetobacter pasteurianus NBRC 3277]GCD64259.1 cobyrinic acid a,c-diamide synthase [Acetobacter pasteurianus NBRC 3278]
MPTIAIISQKGGAGKTTLALHLAAAAEDAGHTALVIDVDPQATASQWAAWRKDAPPRLAAKIGQAMSQGAEFIVIDTPPHADSAASAAVEVADLVLIPCRPSAFDLAAIKTTASLIKMRGKPAFVVFTAGSPTAPRMYEEATQLVQSYGLNACPHIIADRAVFRHAAAEGKTAMEVEPKGKASDEVRLLYKWACKHVNMQSSRKRRASA